MTDVPGGQPTIRSVAERAGVSKSLVSLVLRGSPQVSDAKRRAVLEAIKELGYRPNAAARTLSERRTRVVGVMLNDLRNPWYIECLDGINAVLHEGGLTMLLGDGRLDSRADQRVLQTFMDMRVDGLVLVGTVPISPVITEATSRLPSVVAGSRDLGPPQVDVSVQDDRLGAELATRHLVDLGHRRIAHIAGGFGAVAAIRRRTYEDVMKECGLTPAITTCDMTQEGGYRAAIRLLSTSHRPTAIFSVNDVTAIGALSAASELGISVPEHLSVIGYDNIHLANLRPLWLTTVDCASRAVGRQAAELLLQRIDNPGREAVVNLATPSLVIRGSTAHPG